MTNTEQLREQLLNKLKELFQLNQPDLDFGFYRIMHSRAKEVTAFIENELLDTIKSAFDSAKVEGSQNDFEAARAKVIDNIGEDAFDENGKLKEMYANSKAGKEFLAAQQKLAEAGSALTGEDSVYYHLYRFFSRYYDNGDFVSMRYHTRETEGMARPYAIPYGGEEVMLYWANADQYYIKTAENFNNFSFDITKATVFDKMGREEKILAGIPDTPLMVHFKVVDADEGEHGNIKADPNKKREFFLAAENPVQLDSNGELEIHFEFRQAEDSDKITPEDEALVKEAYSAKNKGDFPLLAITAKIIAACHDLNQKLLNEKSPCSLDSYMTVMQYPCPTDAVKNRILLSKYLYQYTARNTSDYFIHKNLRGFLRREMDFYIKNEIMNLDDIEQSNVSSVENYLILLKVFRKIAGKLIDFLGQLEDFQKKLWLKKKFITQCDYCITLDRIPEKFYPEIVRNEKQWKEWEKLGFLELLENDSWYIIFKFTGDTDTFEVDLTHGTMKPAGECSARSDELGVFQFPFTMEEILKQHSSMLVDTHFFDRNFKNKLLSYIPEFDEQCDGVLIHSENFQALNLLQERYKEQVKCTYIDPPYNTERDRIEGKFLYKDSFAHSTWISMMQQISLLNMPLLENTGSYFISCDENELLNLGQVMLSSFGEKNFVENISWNKRIPKNDKGIGNIHEYIMLFSKNYENSRAEGFQYVMKKGALDSIFALLEKLRKKKVPLKEAQLLLKKFYKEQGFDRGITLYCELDANYEPWGKINMSWPNAKTFGPRYEIVNPVTKVAVPIPQRGWRWKKETFEEAEKNGSEFILPDGSLMKGRIWYANDTKTQPSSITYLREVQDFLLRSVISLKSDGSIELENLGLENKFDYPKPTSLLTRLLFSMNTLTGIFLDFFAGSGTTAHTVINLNREDKGTRKYILVEMGEHLNSVLKPRIEKIVYTPYWKDGKPETTSGVYTGQAIIEDGISHCFKYLRLESYEDTLNNLVMPEKDGNLSKMSGSLKEDYMLHYMLDAEAQDSLLNIRDFANPWGYQLKVKQPNSEASVVSPVDLVETFNYLIGLRIQQYYRIQNYSATFKRSVDPELPNGGEQTRLELETKPELDNKGKWRFQKLEGWIPANPQTPNDGRKKNVLIIWRTLTGNLEQDNLMLDWYMSGTLNLDEKTPEYDIIYVNGSNNLGADRKETDTFQVRLIEEEFLKKMWTAGEC